MLTLSLLAASLRAGEEPYWCLATVTKPLSGFLLMFYRKEELRASDCDSRTVVYCVAVQHSMSSELKILLLYMNAYHSYSCN